ncbi:MAG: FkbM family methyltransferase [Streptosporangiaceae bacterium]
MIRTGLERVSHRLVIKRQLPPPFDTAHIYASTEGGLRYLRPQMASIDPALLALVRECVHPGSVVWDIGANLGLFSFAAAVAAGPSGHVVAVEPDASLIALLRRSAGVNQRHAQVEAVPAAVTDHFGVSRFHIARRNRSTNHLDGFGTAQTGGIRSTELVLTVTLDWLAEHFPKPDVIKIDVEEAELVVLRGAETVLSMLPTLICEVAARNSVAVQEVLAGHGYTLYDGEQPATNRVPAKLAPANTLAIRTSRG